MTYRLRFSPELDDLLASLSESARHDLGLSVINVLIDPLRHSLPYGEDDGIMRTIGQGDVQAVILINHETKSLLVMQIIHLGLD